MEAAVPFALLGSVTLLAVVGWLALAATVIASRPGLLRVALVAAGAALLSAVDVRTALLFGESGADDLPLVRAAGFLLVGAGLYAGGLLPRPTALPGVVVPLAAAPAPALVAAAAGIAAAVGALAGRRDLAGLLVAGALGLAGLASALAPIADDQQAAALAVLALRAGAAAALIVGLLLLARASLLGKVVAAILAGVVLMAGAAVGVVGSTVVASYDAQAASLVEQAADARVLALRTTSSGGRLVAVIAEKACTTAPQCDQALRLFRSDDLASDFVVRLPQNGPPLLVAGPRPLSSAEILGLRNSRAVQTVFSGERGRRTDELSSTVQLTGSPRQVALIAVRAGTRPAPERAPNSVLVYGVRLDDTYAATDNAEQGYGFSVIVGGQVVASNLSGPERREVQEIAASAEADVGIPPDGVTVAPVGARPTVHLRGLGGGSGEPVGLLAVSREAEFSLQAQREALRDLLVTALATTLLVGLIALLLGRRTVDPVRRLTAAAGRVAAGDLSATAAVRSRDEVGTLSRAFDTMTGSLGRASEELRAGAARLQTVLESMSDGLIATDATGRITSINRAALTMAGAADPAAALGQPLENVLEIRNVAGNRLTVRGSRSLERVGEVHGLDGTVTPVSLAATPLEGGDGLVLVLRDTTQEREMDRMKTEFLSNVSHELRTPLTPIRGYADLLASRSESLQPQQVATFAGTILAESLKMNRVVDLLVDVAAIEAGRVVATPRAVPPRLLVADRIEAWEDRAPGLRRRVSGGLPAVLVDPEWVGKALDELIDNAVKHTPVGTRITVIAEPSPQAGQVRIAVRDTGPGIAAADQESLFTSFAQVDGSATRRVGGLGLGLSFVRRLAEDAGYGLTVTSTVGSGTEFALDLPATAAKPAPVATRRAAPAKRAPAKRAPATKAPATKAPATKAPAKRAPATKAPATKAPAKRAPTTKAPTTKAPTTKAAAATRAAAAKRATRPRPASQATRR
ncbi:MAG TPA: ATP-binding protein [Mycobacteriales bacterium]|nr:ATP-binding protein [Mycobacteriales bacterium]